MILTELNLFKFIQEKNLEIAWVDKCKDNLVLWLGFDSVAEFAQMAKGFLSEHGHDVILQGNGIAVELVPICEHYDIDPLAICPKDGET